MEKNMEKKELLDLGDLPQSPYPWLIHNIEDEEELTFYNNIDGHSFTANLTYLCDKRYIWSCSWHEWWIVQNWDDEFFLLNPNSSMERVELPKIESSSENACRACTLTHSPHHPDSRILLCIQPCIFFCRIGDVKFNKYEMDNGTRFVGSGATVGGVVYGLLCDNNNNDYRKFVKFCFREDQTLEIVPMISYFYDFSLEPHIYRFGEYFIKYCNSEFLYVRIHYSPSTYTDAVDFKITKFNIGRMDWEEVRSIGHKYAIFLDGMSGMCVEIDAPVLDPWKRIRGNCIYFVDCNSHHIFLFDLVDGSVSDISWSPLLRGYHGNHEHNWVLFDSRKNI